MYSFLSADIRLGMSYSFENNCLMTLESRRFQYFRLLTRTIKSQDYREIDFVTVTNVFYDTETESVTQRISQLTTDKRLIQLISMNSVQKLIACNLRDESHVIKKHAKLSQQVLYHDLYH